MENAHLCHGWIYCIEWWLVNSWQNAGHDEPFSTGEWHGALFCSVKQSEKIVDNLQHLFNYFLSQFLPLSNCFINIHP